METAESTKLITQLILEVVPKSMRVIKNEMRACARSELTVPQFRILVRLSLAMATNTELADWIGISTPSMTRMVDLLVKRELVSRIPSKEDRRRVSLFLTEKGRKLFDQIRQKMQSKLSIKVDAASPEKKVVLENGLRALKELFSCEEMEF